MRFINRKEEKYFFEKNCNKDGNQVYIIEASSGIGKSEFIKEVSQKLDLEVFTIPHIEGEFDNHATFRNLVLVLDNNSDALRVSNFKKYYENKNYVSKAKNILFKVFAILGKAFTSVANLDITSLEPKIKKYDTFITEATIESLFNYANDCLTHAPFCIIFDEASKIDKGSLRLLDKLIKNMGKSAASSKSIFFFEVKQQTESLELKKYLQNNKNLTLLEYSLEKLNEEHIREYIEQLFEKHGISGEEINIDNLNQEIESGNLTEIKNAVKNFCYHFKEKNNNEIRTLKQTIQDLNKNDLALLYLIKHSIGLLFENELLEIMKKLTNQHNSVDIDLLVDLGIINRDRERMTLSNSTETILMALADNMNPIYMSTLSSLIRFLNQQLSANFNSRYVDILFKIYLEQQMYSNLDSVLIPFIQNRLLRFNSFEDRESYFQPLVQKSGEFLENSQLILNLVTLAYNVNLYEQALILINLLEKPLSFEVTWLKMLILNRREMFEESNEFIDQAIENLQLEVGSAFQFLLVKIMNLIQLERREDAELLFQSLAEYKMNPYYPYLLRVSNVFYPELHKKLDIIKEATAIMDKNNKEQLNEFQALNNIYLCYICTLNKKFDLAKIALSDARKCLQHNNSYNHMILHNEATIMFYKKQSDESIPEYLKNAMITAYDDYDRFAINNNLVTYYLLKEQPENSECQDAVAELEELMEATSFKRFMDKIHYNLYHYYSMMYRPDKAEYYKKKISQDILGKKYSKKLMYETSWKLPIHL